MSDYARCCSCGGDADTDSVVCRECDAKFDARHKERVDALQKQLDEAKAECLRYESEIAEVCCEDYTLKECFTSMSRQIDSLINKNLGLEATLDAEREAHAETKRRLEEPSPAQREDGEGRDEGRHRLALGERPCVSTGIDGELTYGYGELDEFGFWQYPISEEEARERPR